MYASVTNIIPDLDDHSKISGRILVLQPSLCFLVNVNLLVFPEYPFSLFWYGIWVVLNITLRYSG